MTLISLSVKTACLPMLFVAALPLVSRAQVLCVNCYQQNEPLDTLSPNLVLNGGFEAHTCGSGFDIYICPNSVNYACDAQDWICTGGGGSTYAFVADSTFSTVPEGSAAVYFGNFYAEICSAIPNDTSCLVASGCEFSAIPQGFPVNNSGQYGGATGVSLSQTVSGLTLGQTYRLEFWAGGEDFGAFYTVGLFALDVGFGRKYLRTHGTSPGETGLRYEVVFVADSTSHNITFTNWGHVSPTASELILDDVRLTVAPPGLCALGLADLNELAATVSLAAGANALLITGPENTAMTLRLFDLPGRELLQQRVSGTRTIDIANIPSGPLLYEVRTDDRRVRSGRLIKL